MAGRMGVRVPQNGRVRVRQRVWLEYLREGLEYLRGGLEYLSEWV